MYNGNRKERVHTGGLSQMLLPMIQVNRKTDMRSSILPRVSVKDSQSEEAVMR